MDHNVQLEIGKPTVIAQAPPEVREWGFWQFPEVEKAENGDIHVSYHINRDSATAYGQPKGHAISRDDGITWDRVEGFDGYGIKAKNGDMLLRYIPKSISLSEINLPEPVSSFVNYNLEYKCYKSEDMPDYMAEWSILRKKASQAKFKRERVNISIPGDILIEVEGVLSGNFFVRMRKTMDEKLCAMTYRKRLINDEVKYSMTQFFLSEDNGYNWNFVGEIPYEYEPGYDDKAEVRDGFTEPDITFLPDRSAFCLLRTTDGHGIGPMYWSKSTDNLKTWSQPKIFDRLGVWPELLTLDNGVTLVSYGRPGLLVRATKDTEGLKWDEPIEIIKPGVYGFQKDTCSYTGMVTLNRDTALLVYSDFNYPDEAGNKRKTILARNITVK